MGQVSNSHFQEKMSERMSMSNVNEAVTAKGTVNGSFVISS